MPPSRPTQPLGPSTSAHPTFPAPGPFRSPGYYRYPYFGGIYPYYPFFGLAPFWSFWWWGDYPGYYPYNPYTYSPYYPEYPYYSYPEEYPPPLTTELDIHGAAATQNGGAGGIAVAIEGHRFGFHVGVDAFYLDQLYGALSFGSNGTLGVASIHGTYSILSGDSYRLRLEAGGSLISWPDTFAYVGATSVGPDVGASGYVGLVGPLGLVGHARYTPAPVAAVDLHGALALRFANLALTGGWRQLSTARHEDIPAVNFSGPQVGLVLSF